MEPQPTPGPTPVKPAPIMDIAPPPKGEPVLAVPPEEESSVEPEPTTPEASPPLKTTAHKEPSNLPVAAITLAIIFFVVLSALAFYAYTKSQ